MQRHRLAVPRPSANEVSLSEWGNYVSDEYEGHLIRETQGGCKVFPNGDAVCLDQFNELVLLSNQRTSPDIYSERQMKGPEWDEPKQTEINKLKHMFTTAAADDLRVGHLKPVDTMWSGRDKRDADRKLAEKKGRCVLRGDLHKSHAHATLTNVREAFKKLDCCACMVVARHEGRGHQHRVVARWTFIKCADIRLVIAICDSIYSHAGSTMNYKES
eukprot:scaffold15144_cov40-Phaeocystis_antarctica.AAC.1